MAIYKCDGRIRINPENSEPYCTYESPERWKGRCPECGTYCDPVKVGAEKQTKPRITAGQSVEAKIEHISTGISHLDHVLGGGFVKKKTVLFGGPKGTGKSTLMLKVCDLMSTDSKRPTLYASAEEPAEAVLQMCNRFSIANDKLEILGKDEIPDVYSIIERCREVRPILVVFDSLQRMKIDNIPPGAARDLAAIEVIAEFCRHSETLVVVMAHMNKALDFSGSTGVGHDIDTELMIYKYTMEDDGSPRDLFDRRELANIDPERLRTLTTGKNRGGREGQKMFFMMRDEGLVPVARKPTIEIVR